MDAKQAQKILLDERKSLTDLRRQSKEARAPVELDQQAVGRLSRMDALQKQNMELATEQRRHQRLHVIDAALKRGHFLSEGDTVHIHVERMGEISTPVN